MRGGPEGLKVRPLLLTMGMVRLKDLEALVDTDPVNCCEPTYRITIDLIP